MPGPMQLSCLAKSQSICGQDGSEKSLLLKPSSQRPWTLAQAVELFNQFVAVDRLLQAPQSRLPLSLSISHQQQLGALLTAYQQAFEAIQPPLQKFMGYVGSTAIRKGSSLPIPLTFEDLSAFEQAVAGLTRVVGQLQAFSETLTQTPRLDTFNFALSTLFNGIAVVSAALSLVSFLLQLAVPPLLPLLVSLMTACASFAIHVGNKLYEIQCQTPLKGWHQDRKILSEFVYQLQRVKDSAMMQELFRLSRTMDNTVSHMNVAQQSTAAQIEALQEENATLKQEFETLKEMVLATQGDANPPVPQAGEVGKATAALTPVLTASTRPGTGLEQAMQIFVASCFTQRLSEAQIRQEANRKLEAVLAAHQADRQQRQQQTRDQATHFDKKP